MYIYVYIYLSIYLSIYIYIYIYLSIYLYIYIYSYIYIGSRTRPIPYAMVTRNKCITRVSLNLRLKDLHRICNKTNEEEEQLKHAHQYGASNTLQAREVSREHVRDGNLAGAGPAATQAKEGFLVA